MLGPVAGKKVRRLKHFKILGLISSEAPVKRWPVSHASCNASILGLSGHRLCAEDTTRRREKDV